MKDESKAKRARGGRRSSYSRRAMLAQKLLTATTLLSISAFGQTQSANPAPSDVDAAIRQFFE